MKNFDFENFKYNYMAVHCNSQTELDDFIKQCEDNNVITGPDRGFDKNYGYIIVDSERLYCDYVAALKNEDYDIIEWEIENKIDYDREYNILEIKEFPEETEFIDNMGCKVKFENGCMKVWSNGTLKWGKCKITKNWLGSKFKLVKKDKKVEFIEAIKAFTKGKTIKVQYKNIIEIYEPEEFNGEYILTDGDTLSPENILHGEWYIKED
ncbi:hypothetical protein [Clostridium botulinum]|uniref:hypothetical protein n=1 Tax=Clostridium botulinum TaxID=1491 RepID=UPI00059E2173|nr:hypothetical protein [Clostridium botulinum]KIN80959.1 hypothetical protein SD74_13295 [Clostridium botulinum]MCC5437721.1 hypothetical protein [Clostridium botulinum]